jgi:hypothetical protein
MKKLIIGLLISILLVFPVSVTAATPKFRVHVLKNLAPGCNYSINTPVIIDYDNDGDSDVILISKEGVIYFLENLLIP